MIKAIETRYKGCFFRSRLEARWAVFFDALGVQWEYEREGFNLGDVGLYLPDFWLPCEHGPTLQSGTWVEIKPVEPDADEVRKLAALVKETGHRGFLFSGQPGTGDHSILLFEHHHGGEPASVPLERGLVLTEKNEHAGTEFEHFGIMTVAIGSRWPLATDCVGETLFPGCLEGAFAAARSARFEHGESPR